MLLVIDGANVVGSRPDGWWKDRAAAASRLATQLVAARARGALADICAAPGSPGPCGAGAAADPGEPRVLLVLEGAARAATVPDGLEVLLAPRDGDSAMVELAHDLGERGEEVTVVTADRDLTRLLHAVGARTIRPGVLLTRLST